MVVEWVLAACLGLFGWHYAGYPLVLSGLAAAFGESSSGGFPDDDLPGVTVVIIAHNEADVIETRIENVLASDYPTELLEVVVASDASTDATVELARATSDRVVAFDNTPHNKSETRNMAVERASNDIVLFTDADTRYRADCVRRIVDRYADPDVGTAGGTLVTDSFEEGSIGEGMGIYWKWEQYLRRIQGELGVLVKMSGANMSMRRDVFEPVPDVADIDQVAGFAAITNGARSVLAPDAVAREEFPTTLAGELSTRKRITIRSLTALWLFRGVFNPVRRPLVALNTFSYWLLRYLIPVLLVGTTLATAVLALGSTLALAFLLAQAAFYLLALAGYVLERRGKGLGLAGVPFSYCWANLGILLGLLRFVRGERVYAYSAVE